MTRPSVPRRPGTLPSWVVGGLLAAFVGSTYLSTIRRVGGEDELEKELLRELAEEAKRQEASESKA